MYMKMYRKS